MAVQKTRTKRKRRGNSRYFVLFLLIASTLLVLSYGALQVMKRIPFFNVQKVEISGYRFLDAKFLEDIARDCKGKNMFDVSTRDLEKRYLAIKRVQKVHVGRSIPHTLKVNIVERRSMLYVKTLEGNLFPIDGNLIVLDNRPASTLEDMPIANTGYHNAQMIVGRKLQSDYLVRVLELQRQLLTLNPEFEKCISEYYMKDGILYFVETTTGAKIILGDKDLPTRIRRFLFLKENGSYEQNSIFDFRFEDQVVVRKEGA